MGKSFRSSDDDANISRPMGATPSTAKKRRKVKRIQETPDDDDSASNSTEPRNEVPDVIDVDEEESPRKRNCIFSKARRTASSLETSESEPASLSTSTALPNSRGRPGQIKPGLNRVQLPTPDGKHGRRFKNGEDRANYYLIKYCGGIPTRQYCIDQTLKHLGGKATAKELRKLDASGSGSNEDPTAANDNAGNSRPATAKPAIEESPMDTSEDCIALDDENEADGEAARDARSRDRPIRALSRSKANTKAKGSGVDLIELPTRMKSAIYPIPENLISLDRCPLHLNRAPGVEEDDVVVLRDAIDANDWLHSAELLDLGDVSRNHLTTILPHQFQNRMGSILPLFIDSNVLELFTVRSSLDQDKFLAIVGLCARFLHANDSKDLLSLFSKYVLQFRQKQTGSQRSDSLKFALRPHVPAGRHQELLFIYAYFAYACQQATETNKPPVLWELFNSAWFGEGKEKSNNQVVIARNAEGKQLFEALEHFSGLQALSLQPESEVGSTPVEFTPNWNAIKLDLDVILDLKCTTVLEHREILKERLHRICYQFADRLWKVDESIVVNVLDTGKAICAKYETSCSCSTIPVFLSRFSSIADFRARRRSVKDALNTECDCAMFLAWIFVSQQSEIKPGLAGSIQRHGTSFLKAKGVTSDPANAYTHFLGLYMAIADCFGEEHQLCKMLFSKAPKLSTAVKKKTWIVKAWSSLLSAVNLRCRKLLSCGQSVDVYASWLLEKVTWILNNLQKPEDIVRTTISVKEDRRLKHGIFVEILKEILSTLVAVFDVCIRSVDESQVGASKVVDTLLLVLMESTDTIGKFFGGLVSSYGSSGSGESSRLQLMLALIVFIDKLSVLYTCRQDEERRVAAQGIAASDAAEFSVGDYAKSLYTSMVESLLKIAQNPVFGIDSDSDVDLRCTASRTLARIVGLCSIGSDAVYKRGTSNVRDLLINARLDALRSSWLNLPPNKQSIAEPKEHSLKLVDFLVQAEFWGSVLVGNWSSYVLPLSDDMEQTVLSLWVILLVVSYGEGEDSNLGKAVEKFLVGIQLSARTSLVVGSWFHKTTYGFQCQHGNSNDPMSSANTFKLDADSRLEAIVDGLSIILSSWQPLEMLKLIGILRRFICLSGKVMVRKYEEFNASQKFFRTSKDVHDGKQLFFFVQVLSVLFVIEASLEQPQTQYSRRLAAQKPKSISYVPEISDLMSKALNKLRKTMDNTENGCARVQALVITGVSSMKSTVGHTELSLQFSRFLRILGGAANLEGFLIDDKEKLGTFLWRPPYVVTSFKGQAGAKGSSVLNEARKFRQQTIGVLVEEPIRTNRLDSTNFRFVVRAFCKLLKDTTVPSLKEAGVWPKVMSAINVLGDRKKKEGARFGSALNQLIEELWFELSRSCQGYEIDFFAKALAMKV